ncbi:MAG: DNA polymerase III subunit gamma/tau [Legionellales bacterium]
MSYMALARKWRPRTFSQLVGQEHINNTLINALNQQRLHHAYLFTGTRGVGKTSIARILAKALNCQQQISSEPCLLCDACIAIEQGRFIDLIEIDGASKTRVEDTRDLLDNVHYAPTNGRFKIYLIDEVHMLSQHSFNALLKTLEEPPAHVKFILATTDPQKLPLTVLSRCLQFNLKHLSAELICQHLQLILQDEQVDYELNALELLAQAAQGSMRDALSLLDQAITGCDKKIQTAAVKNILGYTQQDYAIQLLEALAVQNPTLLLTLNQQIAIEGSHFHYVLDELLKHLHQISIYQAIGDNNPLISPAAEVKLLAQQFSPEDIQLFYQIAIKGNEELHLAPTLAIGFSMTMLRMLTFRPAPKAKTPTLALQQNTTTLPQQTQIIETAESSNNHIVAQVPASVVSSTHPNNDDSLVPSAKIPEHHQASNTSQHAMTVPVVEPTGSDHQTQDWASIIKQLKLTGIALNAVENAEFVTKIGRELTLRVEKGHQSLFTPATLARIETALALYYQGTVKIILNSDALVKESPAQQKSRASQQIQQQAEEHLLDDPLFQQLKQDFSAELVKNSIVPL